MLVSAGAEVDQEAVLVLRDLLQVCVFFSISTILLLQFKRVSSLKPVYVLSHAESPVPLKKIHCVCSWEVANDFAKWIKLVVVLFSA